MSQESNRQTGITYHLLSRKYYESQVPGHKSYVTSTMEDGHEEFIHCTDGAQNMADTGNRYYWDNKEDFVVMVIDKSQVKAPVIYEDPKHIYPHIYGALNLDAVIRVLPMPRDNEGRFLPPE